MIVQEKLMTVDEFERLYMDRPYELWEGKVVKVSPTAYVHGAISRRVSQKLGNFVDANDLGDVVGAETGFRLSSITIRAPDAAFISKAKLQLIKDGHKFLPFAPDLAIEIVSPSDRADKIQRKIELYQAAKTPLLWIFFEDNPRVVVYELGKPFYVVPFDGTLDGGDVLPGFKIPVAELFPSDTEAKPERRIRKHKGDA